jgi:hypothetical protein
MKHKIKRVHFVGRERAQSRSLLLWVAAPTSTDGIAHEA